MFSVWNFYFIFQYDRGMKKLIISVAFHFTTLVSRAKKKNVKVQTIVDIAMINV